MSERAWRWKTRHSESRSGWLKLAGKQGQRQADRQTASSPAQSSPAIFLLVGFPVCSFYLLPLHSAFFGRRRKNEREIPPPVTLCEFGQENNYKCVQSGLSFFCTPFALFLHPFFIPSLGWLACLCVLACVCLCRVRAVLCFFACVCCV